MSRGNLNFSSSFFQDGSPGIRHKHWLFRVFSALGQNILEHYVPELKEMSEQDAAEFIQIAATCPETTEFLRKRGLRQDENETAPTMERPLEIPLHPSEDTGKN